MLRQSTLRLSALGFAVLVALSACGGGGGSTNSTLPRVPTNPGGPAMTQSVTLTINISGATSSAAAHNRRPLYVSTATQSAAIGVNGGAPLVVNLAAGAPNCVAAAGGGRSCSATIAAPVGPDTFGETLYASTNATGAALSQNTTTATIVAGTANVVNLTLDGVVAAIALSLTNVNPPLGAALTIGLTVNAKDAAGATIIGNDPFANPISLINSDKSGTITTLTKTTLASPADTVSITYNGQPLTSAVFTASANGATSGTVTLTPAAAAGGFNDYTTFGYDNGRDVFNPNSSALTPATLPSLHLAWQRSLGDFNTQSQPILATEIPGHAGALFVGGGSGRVRSFDAQTGASLWTSPGLGQMTYTCDTVGQTIGLGGTAAYDPGTKSLYIVGNKNASQNAYAENNLYRLDAVTGAQLGSVNFAPPQASTSEFNFTHVAVALSNGIAYVGTGSTCDISSWRGAVVAINVPAMSIAKRFYTTWNPPDQPWGGGGVWGWGGVGMDAGGNVFTGVGNADNGLSNGTIRSPFVSAPAEYSGNAETLLELSSGLAFVASNHPIPHTTYSREVNDLDVQGTPLILTPNGSGCGTMAVLQGKSGELNVYNVNGLSAGPTAQFQLASTSSDDAYLGNPAYSPATGLIYAPVAESASPTLFPSGLVAIDPGCGRPSVTWHTAFGSDSVAAGIPRAVPAVSAGGVILAGTVNGDGGDVWALDAATGSVLNGGTRILHTNGHLRVPPTIDGNWVFIIDNSGGLYGLTIDSNFKAIQPQYQAVSTPLRPQKKRRI
jgi:hypothetical protein